MLTCNNITVKRGNNLIFGNVSITLLKGACLIINGSNGCGKTSLLKSISSSIKPTCGQIYYDNTNINDCLEEYLSLINYIGHDQALNLEFTILENLEFWANIYDTNLVVEAAIRAFNLENVIHKKVCELSKGTCKKVLLCLLFIKPAKIWLLDEPFANLDYKAKECLIHMISAKCAQSQIVILSTNQTVDINFAHNLDLSVYSLC